MRVTFGVGRAWLACLVLSVTVCRDWAFAAAPEPSQGHPESGNPQAPAQATLSLADLEQIALQRNPTLAQAAAQIEAARSRSLQAGLYPNPTVSYVGDLIGVQGTAGEFQGGIIQQDIITAGKLRLSRAKYKQETVEAEIQMTAQQLRVVNGVYTAFYDVLAAQRLIEIQRELVKNAEDAVKTTEELVNVGQANPPDLLQAQVEAHQAGVALRDAQRRYDRNWEHLVTLIGAPEMPTAPLAGELIPKGPPLDRESAWHRILEESPESQFAQAEVVRDQITVRREQVEPIPNIRVQGGVGHDSQIGEKGTVGTVQVGITLPIFNRNQGTIQEAKAEVARAQAEVARVELSLRRRLADTFQSYANALDAVQTYRENTLPKAQKALELYMDYFKQRRATWPQVLVAQRTYFQLQEGYIDALVQLRRAEVAIKGLLVVDGMTQPPEPTPQGHINANPNPR